VAIDGDRVDREAVLHNLRAGNFLVHEENGFLIGCVYLEQRSDRAYLGLLSVAPSRQGTGLGRKLVAAAEEFASKAGCNAMDLRIISARSEVMQAFYEHLGYVVTGTSPMPESMELKMPCYFIHMSKSLAPREAV
jgi:GNAT superfamily N-acetyltransferase